MRGSRTEVENWKNRYKMKTSKFFLSAIACAALFVSCGEDKEKPEGIPALSVNPSEVTFDKAEGSQTISVEANREWKASAEVDWITVNPAKGDASDKAQTVTVSVLANEGTDRTGTVTFDIGFEKKTLTVNQAGAAGEGIKPSGEGTLESPYNVAKALEVAGALASYDVGNDFTAENSKESYVKGIIAEVKELSTQFGNATYMIADEAGSETQIEIYRGYYLGGVKFTAEDQIKVGDEVVVFGKLVNFKGNTPEYTQGNKIVSLNGKGAGGDDGDAKEMTIAEMISARTEEGVKVKTKNDVLVAAVTTKGYVAYDGDKAIYVFANGDPGVALGDKVRFSGVAKDYFGMPEIESPSTTKVSSGNKVDYPSVKDITSTFDSYTASVAEYVTYTATATKNGNYTNFVVEGASRQGSFTSAPGSMYDGIGEGTKVQVTGFFNGVNTSGTPVRLNVIVTEVKNLGGGEPGGGDEGASYVYEFAKGDFGTSAPLPSAELNGVVWNISVTNDGTHYLGFDDKTGKGVQVGSSKHPATKFVLSTEGIKGKITKIKINTSGASGTDAKLNVKVGEAEFGTEQALTSSAQDFVLTGSASGKIELIWTCTQKAIYVKSIAITTE